MEPSLFGTHAKSLSITILPAITQVSSKWAEVAYQLPTSTMACLWQALSSTLTRRTFLPVVDKKSSSKISQLTSRIQLCSSLVIPITTKVLEFHQSAGTESSHTFWPVQVKMAKLSCGTWRSASRSSHSISHHRDTAKRSTTTTLTAMARINRMLRRDNNSPRKLAWFGTPKIQLNFWSLMMMTWIHPWTSGTWEILTIQSLPSQTSTTMASCPSHGAKLIQTSSFRHQRTTELSFLIQRLARKSLRCQPNSNFNQSIGQGLWRVRLLQWTLRETLQSCLTNLRVS